MTARDAEPTGSASDDATSGDATSNTPSSDIPIPRSPEAQAREALDRAKASARMRGAATRPARQGRRERHAKREASEPFTAGRDPRLMSESVEALLQRMGWTEQVEVAAVTARWREVIGDQIADHCEPLDFADGVLSLRASSTAWATQLTLMAGQLRHRLNEELGREVVAEIRVYGPVSRSWTRGPRTVKGRGPRDTYG